jgi:hypothetical protein
MKGPLRAAKAQRPSATPRKSLASLRKMESDQDSEGEGAFA